MFFFLTVTAKNRAEYCLSKEQENNMSRGGGGGGGSDEVTGDDVISR